MSKRPKLPLAIRKRRALQAETITTPPSTLTEADFELIEQRLGLDQRIERAIARRLGATNIRRGCE